MRSDPSQRTYWLYPEDGGSVVCAHNEREATGYAEQGCLEITREEYRAALERDVSESGF